eukprot:scaffold148832_cov21-Tisochrysis_lutea.AAC.1
MRFQVIPTTAASIVNRTSSSREAATQLHRVMKCFPSLQSTYVPASSLKAPHYVQVSPLEGTAWDAREAALLVHWVGDSCIPYTSEER